MLVLSAYRTLYAFGRSRNREFPFEVADAYEAIAYAAGINVKLAFAQMCHETGYWTFRGTAQREWNNPAGLGVTGSPDVGLRFTSIEHGIAVHCAHLRCYFHEAHDALWCALNARPFGRHFGPGWTVGSGQYAVVADGNGHLRLPNLASSLSGRWAPSTTYHEKVEAIAELLG